MIDTESDKQRLRLVGKRAIVTGGASGFGAGIVRKFIAEGASVMIADINGEAAHALATNQRDETTATVAACQTDVSSASDVKTLADTAVSVLGGVDIIVNNAGVTHTPSLLEDISEDDFDRVFAVNAKSVYLTAKFLVPLMKAQQGGVILNVASTGGISPRPKLSWYNASKGWMITATRSMAVELAAHGIRVNALNPVAGETPLLKSFMGQDTPEIRAKFLSTIPIGRF